MASNPPNQRMQPTYLPSLRCGKSAADAGRSAYEYEIIQRHLARDWRGGSRQRCSMGLGVRVRGSLGSGSTEPDLDYVFDDYKRLYFRHGICRGFGRIASLEVEPVDAPSGGLLAAAWPAGVVLNRICVSRENASSLNGFGKSQSQC